MVPILKLFFVSAYVVSNVAFVLSLFVPRLFLFWCLGRAVLHDCSISRVSSLIFFKKLYLLNVPLDVLTSLKGIRQTPNLTNAIQQIKQIKKLRLLLYISLYLLLASVSLVTV